MPSTSLISPAAAARASGPGAGALTALVVPTDFSADADALLPVALAIAERTGAVVHLVHVLPPGAVALAPWREQLAQARLASIRMQYRHSLLGRAQMQTAVLNPNDAPSGDPPSGDLAPGDPPSGTPAPGDLAPGDLAPGDPAPGDPAPGDLPDVLPAYVRQQGAGLVVGALLSRSQVCTTPPYPTLLVPPGNPARLRRLVSTGGADALARLLGQVLSVTVTRADTGDPFDAATDALLVAR